MSNLAGYKSLRATQLRKRSVEIQSHCLPLIRGNLWNYDESIGTGCLITTWSPLTSSHNSQLQCKWALATRLARGDRPLAYEHLSVVCRMGLSDPTKARATRNPCYVAGKCRPRLDNISPQASDHFNIIDNIGIDIGIAIAIAIIAVRQADDRAALVG